MRTLTVLLLNLTAAVGLLVAQPPKMVFTAKPGSVTFDHAAHLDRAQSDCGVCHDKLFPQSNAALNYKGAMHKTAEASKTACAGCHYPGGPAFETKGNCGKCHAKA
jgi:c(7)-type cytochrome triheme protein